MILIDCFSPTLHNTIVQLVFNCPSRKTQPILLIGKQYPTWQVVKQECQNKEGMQHREPGEVDKRMYKRLSAIFIK